MHFSEWMSRNGETNPGFGKKAGWSGETVRRYRAGEREPDHAAMATIYALTSGCVTPNDWVGVGPRNVDQKAEQLST
ncbi:XRE family transcriptional regulator [Bradyrhizobium uaiense]|uniref:XRE family transcriptional regulator n=1 Tax=Bradyrhizobium uaiense TaxID=2594946 RepID=A0A6P1B9F0_9BRAD|nr:XRE family transcriptional regulator [Bradyrhizobium uaiense]NEU95077.1 XRE family transcriptional regulator [Bradyrhizobium uaiense]